MHTETIANNISAEDLLYMIMKFVPTEIVGQRPKLERIIMPPSRKGIAGGALKTPWYVYLRHDDAPRHSELAIELRGDIVLGMRLNPGDDADINLTIWNGYKYGASRRHLMLRPTNTNLFAIDLNSTNGTLLNGLPMSPERAYKIVSGDLLSLGKLHVRFARVSQTAEAMPVSPKKTNQFSDIQETLVGAATL